VETFVEGLSTSIKAPQEQVLFCLSVTEARWRRTATGERSEPINLAYRRIVGKEIPRAPVMFAAVFHEGRVKSVNLYPGCVLVVHDPARGTSEIRTLTAEARAKLDRVINVSEDLQKSSYRADRRLGRAGLTWVTGAAE